MLPAGIPRRVRTPVHFEVVTRLPPDDERESLPGRGVVLPAWRRFHRGAGGEAASPSGVNERLGGNLIWECRREFKGIMAG